MTEGQYEIQIQRLEGCFGKAAFENSMRSAMIWETVKNLEYEEFCRIVDQMIGSMRRPPLPADFKEAAVGKRRYITEAVEVTAIKCQACGDLGIVVARINSEQVDTLVLCPCDAGKTESNWRLPAINRTMQDTFVFARCPIRWFKPKELPTADKVSAGITADISFTATIQPLVESWRERVRMAEQFWDHHNKQRTWGTVF